MKACGMVRFGNVISDVSCEVRTATQKDIGVVVAVELEGDGFYLAEVISPESYEIPSAMTIGETKVEAGGVVLDVKKYEPIVPTGTVYTKTEKLVTIFVGDIRHNKVHEHLTADRDNKGRYIYIGRTVQERHPCAFSSEGRGI